MNSRHLHPIITSGARLKPQVREVIPSMKKQLITRPWETTENISPIYVGNTASCLSAVIFVVSLRVYGQKNQPELASRTSAYTQVGIS